MSLAHVNMFPVKKFAHQLCSVWESQDSLSVVRPLFPMALIFFTGDPPENSHPIRPSISNLTLIVIAI